MPYITKYNSTKIIKNFEAKEELDNTTLFKYEIPFFSRKEESELKGLQIFYNDPKRYLEKFTKIEVKDTKKFVYPEKKPSYHQTKECEALQSNYKNYEIPVEVQGRGEAEINEFRKWFTSQECNLLEVNEYIKAVQLKYPYVKMINPKAIEFQNAGLDTIDNLDLNSLENNINILIDSCLKYFNDNISLRNTIRKYQKHTYLAYSPQPIAHNDSGMTDDGLKSFLKAYDMSYKKPVSNLLRVYYRVKYNPELKFEGSLLESLGFKACNRCCL